MRSMVKESFTVGARQAGWISAIVGYLLAGVCLLLASPAGPMRIFVLFPLLPVALGCVAVGALNFRRWHSFAGSLAACFQAVLNVYKILGALAVVGLSLALIYPPAFLYLLILLIYGSLYLAFYISVTFLGAVLVAWVAGAALYGLLWLMRCAGELGQREAQSTDESPKVLRVVV